MPTAALASPATPALTYDNVNVALMPLINTSLPFTDNFTAATNQQLSSNWLNTMNGNFVVANGVATSSAAGPGPVNIAFVNGPSVANVTVQADIDLSGAVGVPGQHFAGGEAKRRRF